MMGISLILCEQVVFRGNGTLDVLNPWITYFSVVLPLDAKICLFSQVAFDESDIGDHVAKLLFVDPNKKETILHHVSVVVEQTPFDWRFPFVVNVKIEKTGLHKFVLKMDKKKIAEAPLLIHAQKGAQNVAGFQASSSGTPPYS